MQSLPEAEPLESRWRAVGEPWGREQPRGLTALRCLTRIRLMDKRQLVSAGLHLRQGLYLKLQLSYLPKDSTRF